MRPPSPSRQTRHRERRSLCLPPRPRFAAVLLVALAVIVAPAADGTASVSAATRPALTWSSLSPPASPPALAGAAAAYDSANATVVVFGGRLATGQLSADTWVWDGSTWAKAALFGASPPARQSASIGFDTALNPPQLILFGGRAGDGTLLDDTWSWNGSSWNQIATTTSPGGREGAAMTADASGQLVLFGGYGVSNPAPPPASTTTTTTPTTVPPSTSTTTTPTTVPPSTTTTPPSSTTTAPSTTSTTTTTVAPTTSTTAPLVAGDQAPPSTTTTTAGGTAAAGTAGAAQLTSTVETPAVLDDTWVLSRSNDGADDWTQVAVSAHPPPTTDASLATAGSGQTVLFGGTGQAPGNDQAAGTTNQTWLYADGSWSHVKAGVAPPARQDAALNYDNDLGAIVAFGGQGVSGALGDTWLWNGSAWQRATTTPALSARSGAAAAYDASARQLVVFGGAGSNGQPLAATEVLTMSAPTISAPAGSSPTTPTTPTTQAVSPVATPGRPGPSTTTTTVGDGSAFGSTSATPSTSTVAGTPAPPAPRSVSVHRGDVITLRGSGFLPHATITVTFHSVTTTLAVIHANAKGAFAQAVPVPAGAAFGHHHFEASGKGPDGMTNLVTAVQVVPLSALSHASGSTKLILVGIALAVPGLSWTALEIVDRRRRRPAPSAHG